MLSHLREYIRKHSTLVVLLVVTIASFVTHFVFFNRQKTSVFDEVYFGSHAQAYYTHEYYFDIHPPLGKLILAASVYPNRISEKVRFQVEPYEGPQPNFARLRFLPAIAGALLPPIVALIAIQLRFGRFAALGAGLVTAFENALVAHSRLILFDNFMLLFGFVSVLFYLLYRSKKHSLRYLLGCGLFVGMTMAIKWTGLSFLALIGLFYLWDHRKQLKKFSIWLQGTLALLLIPLLIYLGAFAVHLALLNKSGPGDAFMTPAFQHTLRGTNFASIPEQPGLGYWRKFVELNKTMFTANKTISNDHPYGSRWYTWPLLLRPIWYYTDKTSNIYLLGNPFTWWIGSVSVIVLCGLMIFLKQFRNRTNTFLLLGFILCWLPFVLITRVMFLYHYFPALVFSLLILMRLAEKVSRDKTAVYVLIGLSVISFIFFAPFTYGLPLEPQQQAARQWLNSWR